MGRPEMSRSASDTIDEVARNAVLEISGMTRVSPLDCISSDFLTAGGSRDRISWRIPFTLTADPSVASRGSDHSLISSRSSLFVFVFLGILEHIASDGATVNGLPVLAVVDSVPGIEQGQIVVEIPVAGGIVGVHASTTASGTERC